MSSEPRPSHSAASSSLSASGNSRKRTRPDNPSTRTNPRRRAPFRNSPFTDSGSYMSEKNRKLRYQFEADASTSSLGSGGGRDNSGGGGGIFHGVSIFVDGFTVPSSQELRGFMLKHGGRFENYFSRHRVTHIICSNLPDSKIKNIRAFSRGLPVVKPAWVMDSLAANKLLSWVPYQLSGLVNETGNQQKLSAFFTPKSFSNFKDTDSLLDPDAKPDYEGSFSKVEESNHLLSPKEHESHECRRQDLEEFGFQGHEKLSEMSIEPKANDLEDEYSIVQETESSSDTALDMDSRTSINKAMDSKSQGASNQHSTLTDPNFVENYFKNSRLHFIGTWRNRYRKRFSDFLSGGKHANTSVNSLSAAKKAAIIHIDMDCFFASVIIRNYPELLDKPVAVCHSDNPKGTAEISSANYPARDYGVKAGMFVRDAKARCPHLVIVHYDFEAYEEVADQFYSILHKHCSKVQALSCDEAYLDVTECAENDPEQVALMIRKEIVETTRCTASAGIAGNLLLARLATRSAKPNGQHFIPSEKVDDYMNDLPIKALPGIGNAIGEKLKSKQVKTCGQLHMIPKEALHKDFGTKIGDMLWNYCRGIDNRMVEVVQETKSVGAEVNWGVRFNDIIDCQNFLMKLCKEVSLRLLGCGVQGRTVTLKVKKRKKGAKEATKFMGCGDCDSMSRSLTFPVATDNLVVLQRITKQIFDSLHIDVKEVRGVGLQLSRLQNVDITKQGHEENALQTWLASSRKILEQCKSINPVKLRDKEIQLDDGEPQQNSVGCGNQHEGNSTPCCINENNAHAPSESHGNRASNLPPLHLLDIEVIKNLPPDIISEVNDMYNGKLCDVLEKHLGKDIGVSASMPSVSIPEVDKASSSSGYQKVGCDTNKGMADGQPDFEGPYSDSRNKGKQPLNPSGLVCDVPNGSKAMNKEVLEPRLINASNLPENIDVLGRKCGKIHAASASCSRSDDFHIDLNMGANITDLMPGSLSQADISILQQLPEDVKADIYEQLPAHRSQNSLEHAPAVSTVKSPCIETQYSGNSKIHLWIGSPPRWIEKFKVSNCLILSVIADLYTKSGTNCLLSPVLQSLISVIPSIANSSSEVLDEVISSLCELLTQYIDLKIESDIEELYICCRLLKRITSISKYLLQVYHIVLPTLQASVSENYGGELQLTFV